MKLLRLCGWLLLAMAPAAWAADGLVRVKSAQPPKEAIDRLERIGYNDPAWIARRHEAPKCAAAADLKKALAGLVGTAAAR